MFRSRFAVAALAAASVTAGCGTDTAEPAPAAAAPAVTTAFGLPGDRAYPEGIALDPRSGDTYVGSYSTGAIYRAAAGASRAEEFLAAGADGRATANGLAVDGRGRLWVIDSTAGVTVYDTATRAPLARFDVPGPAPHFVNDLALTPDGTAYLTDSVRNVLYAVAPERVDRGERGTLAVAAELAAALPQPVAPDALELNGIVADPAGRFLLVVAMTSGTLIRVDPTGATAPRAIALTGGDVRHGDGLALDGRTLWVVHNVDDTISRWTLNADGTAATREATFHDPALQIPTTMVRSGHRALVVSSQFDKGGPMGPGTPGPFAVHAVDGI
ncbi:SMP-30/gluconolactonase/LRE family protein [Nocardia thailandica]|uniref:SMP-30/gluconolactonase/LRE family protein n=1 Tax=Nocardia thailandica TaxID=257275 RepID=UPI0002F8A701|nr:superoxide dismutase [Nocardia thailandica]